MENVSSFNICLRNCIQFDRIIMKEITFDILCSFSIFLECKVLPCFPLSVIYCVYAWFGLRMICLFKIDQ